MHSKYSSVNQFFLYFYITIKGIAIKTYSYIFINSRAYQEILGYQETQELKETRYVLSVFN